MLGTNNFNIAKNFELTKDMSNEERAAYINRKGEEAVIRLGLVDVDNKDSVIA